MATEVTYQDVEDSPIPGAHVRETIRATIDTDTSGNGSLTNVALEGDYGAEPVAAVGGETAESATITNKTTSDLDIVISGASASATVEVEVLVSGENGR